MAIKVIEKAKLNPLELQHLHHEVRVMKMLHHPNVVRLYQVFDTSARLYLILELGSGGDLYDYISSHGQLGEDVAKNYFAQIVSAVKYCHKHHVVHRDLKPENVIFCDSADGSPAIKVRRGDLTQEGKLCLLIFERVIGFFCFQLSALFPHLFASIPLVSSFAQTFS